MKKVLSKEVMDKEASLWNAARKALKESPVKECRK